MNVVMKVLLIDEDKMLCNSLMEFLKNKDSIEVVGVAHDGEVGVSFVNEMEYDIVIMDVVLSKRDGLSILEEIKKREHRTSVIVTSALNSSYIIKRVSEYGGDYFLQKPYDFDILLERIKQVYSDQVFGDYIHSKNAVLSKQTKNECLINKLLNDIGISLNKKGYTYIKTALIMLIENDNLIFSVTKDLYPFVARKYDVTFCSVERAIRHAIESTWKRNEGKYYYSIVGACQFIDKGGNKRKPTNGSFIRSLAEHCKMVLLSF